MTWNVLSGNINFVAHQSRCQRSHRVVEATSPHGMRMWNEYVTLTTSAGCIFDSPLEWSLEATKTKQWDKAAQQPKEEFAAWLQGAQIKHSSSACEKCTYLIFFCIADREESADSGTAQTRPPGLQPAQRGFLSYLKYTEKNQTETWWPLDGQPCDSDKINDSQVNGWLNLFF